MKTNITKFAKLMHDPKQFRKDLQDIYSRIHVFSMLYGTAGWEALNEMLNDDKLDSLQKE